MSQYLLVLDEGTTSTRARPFNRSMFISSSTGFGSGLPSWKTVLARMRASRPSDQFCTYQASWRKRTGQGISSRPLICDQPVIPGRIDRRTLSSSV